MLIRALRDRAPGADFFGLGGDSMAREGLRTVVRLEEVAVMGITEVVAHMPGIYARYRRLKASIRREKPDLGILIDFPDVNLRLAAELHRLGVPVLYFVSPQLWAWKKRRIHRVKRYVTKMLVIFPFEEAFYRDHQVPAEFVGHPLADLRPPEVGRERFAAESGLDASKPWISLLPGSRRNEMDANLPPMLDAARVLGKKYEYVLPAAPALGTREVEIMLNRALHRMGARVAETGAAGLPRIVVVSNARAALFHARASVVASGTATVEAALMGNPFLVVYRISALSYWVASRVIHVPHVAMVNLVAGRRVVPELIQRDFTGEKVAESLRPLLAEGAARATMQSELASVVNRLRKTDTGGAGDASTGDAIGRVAVIALELVSPEKLQVRRTNQPSSAEWHNSD